MANDTVSKELAYPCKTTDVEMLDAMLNRTYNNWSEGDDDLFKFLHWVPSKSIRFERVRHLRIVGDDDGEKQECFVSSGLSRGFHLSADRSWLLLILPEKPRLGEYLQHFGTWLKSLWIMNTQVYSWSCEKTPNLEELYLEDNGQLDSLEALERLTVLERLSISSCPSLVKITDLGKLRHLTKLYISSCENLPALPGLDNLTQLTSLSLSRCDNLTQLPPLDNLKLLTSLDLSGCNSLTQLPPLDNLTLLTSLNLSRCTSLTQLPPLNNLTLLSSLDLFGCSNLKQLPPLNNLTLLSSLDFSWCHNLTQLPPLDNLTHLSSLDLFGCSILAQLPPLDNLTQLTYLNLSWSSIKELPEAIHRMKALRYLGLWFLNLRTLPDWLPDIAEQFSLACGGIPGENRANVYLGGTTVDDISDMSIFDQPYEVVCEFFKKRRLGQTHPLNEIKVVFLGDGEAGKSHTIARLMNDGGDPDHAVFDGQSTPGIVIRNKEYMVGDRKFTVHYWDFGGQEIMHSMHRIFLTGRTMYVILLNARDDTQNDRARYWLHNVKSFAPDAPVLLVLNKIDQNPNASVDEKDLRGRYDKLKQVVRLSAKDFTPKEFNEQFTDILLDEIQKTGYLDAQWPDSWSAVKKKLEDLDIEKNPYIMGDKYEDICTDCQVNENQENLLHWFNDLGVSFCCRDAGDYALKDYVILRPDWITNALYIILFNHLEGAKNGLIPHRSIFDILSTAHKNPAIRCTLPQARYNSGDIQYVLGIMRKFNLSFPHGSDHEFIPMLCQQNSTVDVQYYQKDADTLEFNMEFDYLPNNLLHRLMVERHSELDIERVWRTGASFRLADLGYSAVVVIDGNTLRFFIRHSDPMHRPNTYLTMLKANVDRIVEKMGLKPPTCLLIYKLDGKRDEFDYEDVKLNRELGDTKMTSKAHRKKVLIEDILNQSAPDGLEDERKLLDAIRRSCQNIQGEPDYILNGDGHGMEDKRNRRIRDDLSGWGYNIQDQSQRGRSGSGSSIGELDLLLYNDKREPWTVIEALRVSNGTKTEWKKHLDKLVGHYNYFGAPYLYLLTYVDADPAAFARIWKGYQTRIPEYHPGQYTYCEGSYTELNDANSPKYVKTARCQYSCGGDPITVYHIFARIPLKDE